MLSTLSRRAVICQYLKNSNYCGFIDSCNQQIRVYDKINWKILQISIDISLYFDMFLVMQINERESVFVCVWERERERQNACAREREREYMCVLERDCVCVCVCECMY